ncbi:MAG: ankyrin repeat domain-containing protein [Candidatus Babeliales bacterium]|jgi:hypothetical protein
MKRAVQNIIKVLALGLMVSASHHLAAMIYDVGVAQQNFLDAASLGKDTDIATWLKLYELQKGSSDFSPNCCDAQGNTAVILATRRGNLKVIKLLAECAEINFNALNKERKSALVYAAEVGNTVLVRRLLEYGTYAQIDYAFSLAAQRGHEDVATLLAEVVELLTFVTPQDVRKFFVEGAEKSFDEVFSLLRQKRIGCEVVILVDDDKELRLVE